MTTLFAAGKAQTRNAFDLGRRYRKQTVEVWPDNWEVWCLFEELSGQWDRAGMDGVRVGMKYEVLFRRMDDLGLTGEKREQMFQDIRHMEREALQIMNDE